ncbi:MAG: sulfate ABC transporter permease subunit CysT [Lentisphaeria bacterium]
MFTFKEKSVLPGFGITLGFTLFYLSFIVLIPLFTLITKTSEISFDQFIKIVSDPRVIASFKLTFSSALIASFFTLIFGTVVAFFLERVNFPLKKIIDGLIDLPFAMPTAICGIALATIYSPNGSIGSLLAKLNIKVVYTQTGIIIAMIFIGLPFVVRTLQPAIQSLGSELDEAALNLGASKLQTFTKITLPLLMPAALTGFVLAFARGLGEYGTIIFIAGNMPMKTEATSLLIVSKLEQYDYTGGTAIAITMLTLSLTLILSINIIQSHFNRKIGGI